MSGSLSELWGDENAITTVEYAMLLTVVSVASLGAWTSLGESIRNVVNEAASRLNEAAGTDSAAGF